MTFVTLRSERLQSLELNTLTVTQTSLTVHVTSLELSVHVFMYLLIVRDIKVRGVDTGTECPLNCRQGYTEHLL